MKILCLLAFMFISLKESFVAQNNINGAWIQKDNTVETVLIIQPGYFSVTTYDVMNKKFLQTWGGNYKRAGNTLSATIEFNSEDKTQVGKKQSFELAVNDDKLNGNIVQHNKEWKQVDNNNGPLAGLWVITGREQNGAVNKLTPGDRKTIKLLSGTRFQWAAINSATGEFFGTGGGNYTFRDGIYTENIEFFSRDSTRVGKSLSFKGSVNGNEWEHSGKSSKGDPVHEIWTRFPW